MSNWFKSESKGDEGIHTGSNGQSEQHLQQSSQDLRIIQMPTAQEAQDAISSKLKETIDDTQTGSKLGSKFVMASVGASSISNMAGIAAGHPLDTIKIRMQMDPRSISMRQATYELIVAEGSAGLYRGMLQPMLGATPISCLVFFSTEAARQHLSETQPEMTSTRKSLLAGAVSGIASLFICVPGEVLKCRQQVTNEASMSYTRQISNLYSTAGIRGLYKGFWAMAWRDIPGWAAYFGSYEYLKESGTGYYDKIEDEEKRRLTKVAWTLNAGGVAGAFSWLVSVPQDIIKSKQMTHMGDKNLSMVAAYQKIVKKGGFASMFKGIRPTLMRGYLVNAITLPLYDTIFDRLSE